MVDLPNDARLAAILASVGDHLIVDVAIEPPGTFAVAPIRTGARRRPGWKRVAIAAAVVAVVLASSLALPPVRTAVARWLGIGSTEVRFGGPGDRDLAGLPTLVTGARPLQPAEAESVLAAPLPDTSGTPLGPAQQLAQPPEGGVVMLWSQGATTLWVHRSQASAEIYLKKLATADNRAVFVDDLGDGALLVAGEHMLVTPSRRLAARTVLLWTTGSMEYRLESDLEPDDMVAVGRAID
jgi:hypothetical protein